MSDAIRQQNNNNNKIIYQSRVITVQRHDHLNLAWSVWNPDRCWEPMRRPYAYRGPFGFDTRRAELPCEAPSIQTRASLLQRVPICRQRLEGIVYRRERGNILNGRVRSWFFRYEVWMFENVLGARPL